MKKIIQYLRISAIVIGAVAFLAGKNASAQTCTNTVTSYPASSNGVTINYYGEAYMWNGTPKTCNQPAPATNQYYGATSAQTTGTYVFSSPVNDIVFWVGGMHNYTGFAAESVTWSLPASETGVVSINTSQSNYCLGTVSGATFTATNSQDQTGTNSAGGYFTIHSTTPFTNIRLTHTQGYISSTQNQGGSSVSLCSSSVVPCLASPTLSAVSQPTCTTSTGSFTITNYSSALTYTITPAGATRSGSVITAPAGTGPYSVTASNGTCSSGAVQSGTVNAQPSTPASPVLSAVTQPTCTTSTGSFNITNYNAALTYTITPAGATRSGSVITAPAGTGPYSVTASNGTCSSGAVQSGTVNAQPSTPSAPTISASNPTCTVLTGSVAVNSPVSGAIYTLSPGNTASSTGSFTGLAAGSGPYTVTSTIAYCTSTASNSVSVGAAATGCAGTPDLRPLISMTDVGFIKPSALSKSATLKLFNVGDPNSLASGLITLYLYPPNNNFSIALGASPGWSLAYDAGGNYYTLTSSSTTISYGTPNFKAINLIITAVSAISKGKYNVQFEVGDASGGETNNLNNTVSVEVTVSGI